MLAFLLELGALASVGLWGFSLDSKLATRLVAGLGGPLALIVVWAAFGAPSASVQLHGAVRLAFEVAWFGLGVAALAASGRTTPAVVFAVLFAVNAALVRVWHQQ